MTEALAVTDVPTRFDFVGVFGSFEYVEDADGGEEVVIELSDDVPSSLTVREALLAGTVAVDDEDEEDDDVEVLTA